MYWPVLLLLVFSLPFSALSETAHVFVGYQCINSESEKTIFGEPNKATQPIGVLERNTIFQVLDENVDWLRISFQDAHTFVRSIGWISKEAVRKTAYYDGVETAVVHNPNPLDRLHLRAKPKTSSQSLGKYYNGVVVAILEKNSSSDWVKVRIGTLVGYMQTRYLDIGATPISVPATLPSVMISNSAGKGLNLREYPRLSSKSLGLYGNGTQVLVLGITEQWYHVQIGDECGFVLAKGMKPQLQYSYSEDSTTQKTKSKVQKAVVTGELLMYQYDSENSLEVITTLPTGAVVTVLKIGDNGWTKVSNGIREGYVYTEHLKFE